MSSKADICNLALSHLANSTEVQDVDNEPSKEAQACRRFFDVTRDEVLRDFVWPFATATGALALVASQPTQEWAYSYRMPAGCLFFRRILSGARMDSRQSRIPYRIFADASGQLIFTDWPSAQAEWTTQVTNTQFFASDFVNAFSFLLAHRIGPRIAGADMFKLSDRAFQLYRLAIQNARSNAANEEELDDVSDSEFERARNSSLFTRTLPDGTVI